MSNQPNFFFQQSVQENKPEQSNENDFANENEKESNEEENKNKRSGSIINTYKKEYGNQNKGHFIYVKDPQTKEGVGGFTSYLVECSLIKKGVLKRYSDFYALRCKLVERWPGIFIPNIPPKKIVGNKDNMFVENRCRMLYNFCQKLLHSFHYFFKSEEFKIFLNGNDVEKDLSKLIFSYEEVMIRYKNAFVNLIDDKETNVDDGQSKINAFLNNVLVKADKSIKVSFHINYLIY